MNRIRGAATGRASGRSRWLSAWAVGAALVAGLATPTPLVPHEIPVEVTVRAFVVPEGDRLHFVVRVPLEAMRDFAFPLRGPGYLALGDLGESLEDAAVLWISDYVEFFADGRSLGPETLTSVRISLPSDPSFGSVETARAHVVGPPLSTTVDLPWQQAMLDAAFEVPITSDTADFAIEPRFAHLGLTTLTVLQFVPPASAERAFQFTGDPGRVRLDPGWYHAAFRFIRLGFGHILDGLDHLLFLLCLVIPLRRFWALLPVVTAFTLAHSITLVSSAFGIVPSGLWFPPLIETLIALSIVYMAVENILGTNLRRRWMMAFGFGLVHGFGFSFALRETLQFAGSHLLASLLAFNVGVELGQVLVLVIAVPALRWLYVRIPERMGTIVLSTLVAHTAWHWLTERGSDLSQFRFSVPALDALFLAATIRWLMLALVVGAVMWVVRRPFERWSARVEVPSGAGESAVAGEGH